MYNKLLILIFALAATVFASDAPTTATTAQATSLPSPVEKPVLYYFTSPTCPACAMMAPVIKEAQKTLGDRMEIKEFRHRTPERTEVLKKFMHRVDLNYIPTWILTDSTDRVYTSGKGFVPLYTFSQELNEGLDKQKRMGELKVKQIIFVCETGGPACESSEKALDDWIKEKPAPMKVEKVDVGSFKTQEEWQDFFSRINQFRYMQGMEYIPALIALSDSNEMVDLLQKGFSKTEIESRLKGLY